jgi:hypothetical protein
MHLRLHANATTKPCTRAYVQRARPAPPRWPANWVSPPAPWRPGMSASRSRSLDPTAPSQHQPDGVGRSSGGRAAPLTRPAARRHHRGDATLRNPELSRSAFTAACSARRSRLASQKKAPAVTLRCPGRLYPHHVKYLPPLNRRGCYAAPHG